MKNNIVESPPKNPLEPPNNPIKASPFNLS
jgi:hypothetical protein